MVEGEGLLHHVRPDRGGTGQEVKQQSAEQGSYCHDYPQMTQINADYFYSFFNFVTIQIIVLPTQYKSKQNLTT